MSETSPGSAAQPITGSPRIPALEPEIGSLGEGGTPLLDIGSVHLKCEHLNPTGSYKDRIAAVGIRHGLAAGARGWVGTSSGNGGAAFAAYGSRFGLPGTLFVIEAIVPDKLRQILAFGPRVYSIRGFGRSPEVDAAVFRLLEEVAETQNLVLGITAKRYNSTAMDGVKQISIEIAEDLGDAPPAVYVPTGGGGLCSSLATGFADLKEAGATTRMPRIVAVQPTGCAPIHAAAVAGAERVTPTAECTSEVSGLQLTHPPDGDRVLGAVRSSDGWTMAIDDEVAFATQKLLSREHGIYVEPASALAYAGYLANPVEGAVVVMTGNGLKSMSRTPVEAPEQAGIDDIADILAATA